MNKSVLHRLADRLAQATGPDWELDAKIACQFVYQHCLPTVGSNGAIHDPADGGMGIHKRVDKYTASIDAALALVERLLPGWRIWMGIGIRPRQEPHWCALGDEEAQLADDLESIYGNGVVEDAPTPALAILRALVAALMAQEARDAQAD